MTTARARKPQPTGWEALAQDLAQLRARLVQTSTYARACADHAPARHERERDLVKERQAKYLAAAGQALMDWERMAHLMDSRTTP